MSDQRETALVEKHELQHVVKATFKSKQKRESIALKRDTDSNTSQKKPLTEPTHVRVCDGVT